ncbi:MAG: DNA repair protein RecO [Myxococcales bacterium]|nr:DNA repair protein RecO [Myxococcales bacterium]
MSEAAHAFVLRAVDYRDHDRIVTLLTREHGRVGVLARGARRSRRRFAGAIEPFQRLRVRWRPTRGSLGALDEAVVERSFAGLLSSLPRMEAAGQAVRLVRELAAEDHPEPELFDGLEALFELLALAEGPQVGGLELAFRLRALQLAGLEPGLEACGVSGTPCPPGRPALFDPMRGTVVARAHGGGPFLLSARVRAKMRAAAGPGWHELAWEADELAEATPALDAFVTVHVRARPA